MSDLNYRVKMYAARQNGKLPAAGWVVVNMFEGGRIVKTYPYERFKLHIVKAKVKAAFMNSRFYGENR